MSALPIAATSPGANPLVLARGVVEALRELAARADATFAPGWAWEERSSVIAALDRATELIGLYRSRVLSAHKEDGRWSRSGDRSFESYRGRTTGTGTGAARAEMELADGLAALPQAARAVEDGQVSLAHAEVLTRLRARSSGSVQHALDAGGAAELLAAAGGLDAPTFARRAAAWAAAQDVEAAERSFEGVRTRRYGRIVDRDGGTKIDAFVDPVVGATFRTALEAVTPVPGADDDRTSGQRCADAFALLAARALDSGSDKIGAQIRPHISLIVPAETWAATRERRSGDGAAFGLGSGGTLVMPELDDGTVIPLSELERIACDCELTRVVMDSDGIPLDVGQTERTYSKSLRRSILVRDGHCQWPGCTLRASWCDVHHVTWFSHGGETSARNALTLCVFHHHEVHRRHVAIAPTARGHTFTHRDGTVIGTTTRDSGILRMLVPRRDGPADGDGQVRPQDGNGQVQPPDGRPRGADGGNNSVAGAQRAGRLDLDGGLEQVRRDGPGNPRELAGPAERSRRGQPPPTGELF